MLLCSGVIYYFKEEFSITTITLLTSGSLIALLAVYSYCKYQKHDTQYKKELREHGYSEEEISSL